MRLCLYLCTEILFIVTRISERSDIQSKWYNASIKLIKRLHDVGFGTDAPHIKSNF